MTTQTDVDAEAAPTTTPIRPAGNPAGVKATLDKAAAVVNASKASTASAAIDYMQGEDGVPRDTLSGLWYRFKCYLAVAYNGFALWVNDWSLIKTYNEAAIAAKSKKRRGIQFMWEPKEPHDRHYREFTELVVVLVELVKTRRRTVAVLGSKGGIGKTPLSTWLAALLCLFTPDETLIVDANHNEGTTGPMLGISRRGLVLLRQALRNPSLLEDSNLRRTGLGIHEESGLRALLSNPNAITKNVKIQDVIILCRFLLKHYDSIVFDGGNGNGHAINDGAAHIADNLLHPALKSKRASFDVALSSMLGFYDLGHKMKVKNSLKIVGATHRKDTRKYYVELYRKLVEEFTSHELDPRGDDDVDEEQTEEFSSPRSMNIEEKANPWYNKPDELMEALGITEENIFLVPYSEHIAQEQAVSLKRKDVGMPTLLAYMRILVRIFQMEVEDEAVKYTAIDTLFFTKADGTPLQPSKEEVRRRAFQTWISTYDDAKAALLDLAFEVQPGAPAPS